MTISWQTPLPSYESLILSWACWYVKEALERITDLWNLTPTISAVVESISWGSEAPRYGQLKE